MSNKPIEVKPQSGQLADELESFRRQWKEDLKSQQKPAAASNSNSGDSASTSKQPLPASDSTSSHKRRLSHTFAREGYRHPANGLREQDDGFRSYDLEVQPSLSLGPGERTLTSKPLTTALDYYEAAAEKEEEGNLNESVKLYRKAFKMDPSVEKQYKEKHFPQPPSAAQTKKEPVLMTEQSSEGPILLPTKDLIPTLSSVPITPDTRINLASLKGKESYNKLPPCPISTIPREILIQIMTRLGEIDLSSFVRCATVCKALCYLVYTERQVWKTLCDARYEDMIWGPSWACDIKGKPLPRSPGFGVDEFSGLGSLTSDVSNLAIVEEDEDDNDVSDNEKLELLTRPYDEIEVLKYNGSYRTMFIERPRIRYNGVYISTCTYLRSGHMVTNSLALSNPVHLVTYYRYRGSLF
ncbi:hypothetical protein TWF694_009796 [Orbilia ellipsospora]|uniref:F-box domain-containing protein n=1 Tax=Orbilia ellipsospora TaxID=2528407 RepID=A0AAV9XF18_9PEZI